MAKPFSISIVGAGQAGLLLGIALLKKGFAVNLFSDKTAEQYIVGRILSSQGIFNDALAVERVFGLNYWDAQCPQNQSVTFSIADSRYQLTDVSWIGFLKKPFQSIDQRMKYAKWLKTFVEEGGKLHIEKVNILRLNQISETSALTIIATGKGELSNLFPTNQQKSPFSSSQRVLSCLYVNNMKPQQNTQGVRVNIIPGIGEFFTMPGLTLNGPCEMMLFEGIPNGPFDSWDNIYSAQEQLEHAKILLHQYIPWEFEHSKDIQLTDDKATLLGRYAPVVRFPIANLDCGKAALGLADAVVLNDPIAGQGANNATKAAEIYYNEIISNTNGIFDEAWMKDTFTQYWSQHAKWATKWSNLLLQPPPPHIQAYLKAAETNQALADKLAEGFNNPASLFPWIESAEQTMALIKGLASIHD